MKRMGSSIPSTPEKRRVEWEHERIFLSIVPMEGAGLPFLDFTIMRGSTFKNVFAFYREKLKREKIHTRSLLFVCSKDLESVTEDDCPNSINLGHYNIIVAIEEDELETIKNMM